MLKKVGCLYLAPRADCVLDRAGEADEGEPEGGVRDPGQDPVEQAEVGHREHQAEHPQQLNL